MRTCVGVGVGVCVGVCGCGWVGVLQVYTSWLDIFNGDPVPSEACISALTFLFININLISVYIFLTLSLMKDVIFEDVIVF